jgi:hypothetical protein
MRIDVFLCKRVQLTVRPLPRLAGCGGNETLCGGNETRCGGNESASDSVHTGEPDWGGQMAGGMMRSTERRRPMAGGRLRAPVCRALAGVVAAAAVVALAVAGCGSASAHPASTPSASRVRTDKAVTSCGTTRTAANVPVRIHVQHGRVSCKTAMTVERGYASAIAAGREPGNGGGGPVKVSGWTCQGFTTPVVLRTGNASKCAKGKAEVLAILPAPA